MRLIPIVAIALASLIISTQIGAAADLPTKAPPLAPVAAPTWTGFYVGLNAGYMWANRDVSSAGTPGPCDPTLIGCTSTPNYSTLSAIGSTFSVPVDLKGFIGGGQIGYNWQFTNWVAGLEADFQGIGHHDERGSFFTVVPQPAFPAFPLNSAATVSRSIDYLGTVRGRLGWLATPALLLYGTGGLAYGKVSLSTSIVQGQTCIGCFFGVPSSAGSASKTLAGWTLGGGLEWMFAPHWTVKGEYLYYDLGELTVNTLLLGFEPTGVVQSSFAQTTTRFNGSIARAGINYKF